LPFELEAYQTAEKPRLIDVIQHTYIGTLDCPLIDGMRDTADVLTGYQAVGVFRPELWFFVKDRGRDVGCLLINVHPDVLHAEIVYLALVPDVRGRGWGLQLARQALWVARATHCQRAVLAVDADNAPAVELYRAAGFQAFDRRAVWLRTFHEES
jgi:ribosomal protein S18 acetylase RimI-like enzyme